VSQECIRHTPRELRKAGDPVWTKLCEGRYWICSEYAGSGVESDPTRLARVVNQVGKLTDGVVRSPTPLGLPEW
jgi:hypothetical protein